MNAGFRREADAAAAAAGGASIRFWMRTFRLRFQRTGGRIDCGRRRLASALHSEGCCLLLLLLSLHPYSPSPSFPLPHLSGGFVFPPTPIDSRHPATTPRRCCSTCGGVECDRKVGATLIVAAITRLIFPRPGKSERRPADSGKAGVWGQRWRLMLSLGLLD